MLLDHCLFSIPGCVSGASIEPMNAQIIRRTGVLVKSLPLWQTRNQELLGCREALQNIIDRSNRPLQRSAVAMRGSSGF